MPSLDVTENNLLETELSPPTTNIRSLFFRYSLMSESKFLLFVKIMELLCPNERVPDAKASIRVLPFEIMVLVYPVSLAIFNDVLYLSLPLILFEAFIILNVLPEIELSPPTTILFWLELISFEGMFLSSANIIGIVFLAKAVEDTESAGFAATI